jgi:hypothetical protein
MSTVPFYERTLDSFADDIITRVRQEEPREGRETGWYAVIDFGVVSQVSDPDFSGYGATREEAIRRTAKSIRNDAAGIGKYAPHSCFRDGYDLRWRLMKHWDVKERLALAGVDYPSIRQACHDASGDDRWQVQSASKHESYFHRRDKNRVYELAFLEGFFAGSGGLDAGGLDAACHSAMEAGACTNGIAARIGGDLSAHQRIELTRRLEEQYRIPITTNTAAAASAACLVPA